MPLTFRARPYAPRDLRDMMRPVLGGEGTLRRRYRRSLAIGLELNAIPLHVDMEAKLFLRMAHSGEDKGGVGAAARRFSTELLITRMAT